MDREERKADKKFYPDYLTEILFFVFVTIEITLVLAMLYPQTIGRPVDFTARYQPKPEWYFLWLYQLVRYFPGKSAFVGTVLIPAGAVALLTLIPFIDRGRRGRLKATVAGLLLLLTFLVFTIVPAVGQ